MLRVFAIATIFSLSLAAKAPLCPNNSDGNRVLTDSVLRLRPADIDFVMATGDSIMAAFAAEGGPFEYRGVSFGAGAGKSGDALAYTLFNLFKSYNPKVGGGSDSTHILELPKKIPHFNTSDGLNAAQSTADVYDLKGQLDWLLERLKSGDFGDPATVMNDKWKHLSIFIGANNLCGTCRSHPDDSAEAYKKAISEAVQYLYDNMPKTLVSLISLPRISKVRLLEDKNLWCRALHVYYAECACIFQGDAAGRAKMDVAHIQYNQALRDIQAYWKDKVLNDTAGTNQQFAVIYHPFNEASDIPSLAYLSGLDCFHPSALAHENFAIASWNSLFVPLSEKITNWNFKPELFCPGPEDYIRLD